MTSNYSLQVPENKDESRLAMWRCIVTMAHADNVLDDSEKTYLTTMFRNMKERAGLPQEHLDILMKDLEHPPQMGTLLPHLTAPKYRAQVVYFARLLAYKDGDFSPSEQRLLDKLHLNAEEHAHLEDIRKDVAYNVQKELVAHEAEADTQPPKLGFTSPLSFLIDQLALHFGIDLMDE